MLAGAGPLIHGAPPVDSRDAGLVLTSLYKYTRVSGKLGGKNTQNSDRPHDRTTAPHLPQNNSTDTAPHLPRAYLRLSWSLCGSGNDCGQELHTSQQVNLTQQIPPSPTRVSRMYVLAYTNQSMLV